MTRLTALLLALLPLAAQADTVERGKYLTTIMGCTDCHTPGHFLGQPDMARFLGGSDVGFEIPGLGTFYGPNLTPDATGLGNWTEAEIATFKTDADAIYDRVRQNYAAKGVDFDAALALFQSELTKVQP